MLSSVNIVQIEANNKVDAIINTTEDVDDLSHAYSSVMNVDVKIRDKSMATNIITGATHTFTALKLCKHTD